MKSLEITNQFSETQNVTIERPIIERIGYGQYLIGLEVSLEDGRDFKIKFHSSESKFVDDLSDHDYESQIAMILEKFETEIEEYIGCEF